MRKTAARSRQSGRFPQKEADAMYRESTCCFSGHRPEKLPWGTDEGDAGALALKGRIAQALDTAYRDGYRHFICGMARGCDLYFCEAALALRDRREGVSVEAAIPCPDQAARWSARDRARWENLVKRCDYEMMVQHQYSQGCMHRRNRYMVDRSSRLIAAFDGSSGGTRYTVAYAMRQGLDIVKLEISY